MFITVYLMICLNAANHATCSRVYVTDSTQAQPDDSIMTMGDCLGKGGAVTAQKYWDEHPDLHTKFEFGGWSCEIGNKKAPQKQGV